jgi:hypothetical protein
VAAAVVNVAVAQQVAPHLQEKAAVVLLMSFQAHLELECQNLS